MKTGKRIEQLAKNKKINLHRLAEESGVSYNTLYSIVKRNSNNVDLNTVRKIALVLDVHPIEIYGDDALELIEYGMDIMKRAIETNGIEYADNQHIQHEIIDFYNLLNSEGKKEAIKRISELTEIERYRIFPNQEATEPPAPVQPSTDTPNEEKPPEGQPGHADGK